MKTVKCLICEKDVHFDEHGCLMDAGYALLSFHYGSKNDQCYGFAGRKSLNDDALLGCDEIEAYICDSCFENKRHLCHGFDIDVKTTRTEKI